MLVPVRPKGFRALTKKPLHCGFGGLQVWTRAFGIGNQIARGYAIVDRAQAILEFADKADPLLPLGTGYRTEHFERIADSLASQAKPVHLSRIASLIRCADACFQELVR